MKLLILLATCLLYTITTLGQNLMMARVVAEDLYIPWELVYGDDDHIWFTQKNGYICKLDPVSGQLDTVITESQSEIRGEGGMLGLTIENISPENIFIYAAFQYANEGDYVLKVKRYDYNTQNNTLNDTLVLIDNISGALIHNGCRLMLVEDKLFITTGDAGNTALPQDLGSLNGKILRLNTDGSIPDDNPIPGSPIWSWGHRNAQGLIYLNGVIFSSEHGPDTDDEINIITKGGNYGWPNVSGFCDSPSEQEFCMDSSVIEPLVVWTPTIAPSGMAYYEKEMFPQFQNSILLATLKDENLYQLSLNDQQDSITSIDIVLDINFGRLRSVCIAPDGKIYLSTSNSSSSGTEPYIDKIIELSSVDSSNSLNKLSHQKEISIHPNPVSEQLYIQFTDKSEENSKWSYSILNILGKSVQQGSFNGRINVKMLPQGAYFIKLHNQENHTRVMKFIKS